MAEDLIVEAEQDMGLTIKGTPRKRKPKTKNVYFTSETEEAILRYRAAPNQAVANQIYNKEIHYAFYKLAENIIHTLWILKLIPHRMRFWDLIIRLRVGSFHRCILISSKIREKGTLRLSIR